MADNTLVAAHLAAALISRSDKKPFTPEDAVARYRSVLQLLDDNDAEVSAKRAIEMRKNMAAAAKNIKEKLR